MPKAGTITTKEGNVLTIEEWLEKKERLNPEFSKLQEKEVKEQRRCLKKRVLKNGISPEYNKEHSEVRFLTNEEIIKEYKMEEKVTERGNTIRELIKFLQQLEGRKVSTDIIVQKIKKPVKSVSSFLSQLFNVGIVTRVPMKDHKRKFIWGIAIPYKNGELEAIVSTFNDFTSQKRRDRYLEKKKKEEVVDVSGTESDWRERMKKAEREKLNKEFIEEQEKIEKNIELEQEISTPSSNTLRIVVEGNIKILFGLAK